MLAILVILCPPLAVLLTASPLEAVKNIGLSLLLYVPGVVHAHSIVERYRVNRRYDVVMSKLEARDTRPVSRAA